MLVGWQGGGKRDVSGVETVSLGGLFLFVEEPLAPGTSIELIFDAPNGEVRARAVVRHGRPGRGMGVQFVHMRAEHRGRLHLLVKGLEAEQRTGAVAAPRGWFGEDGRLPDSGEIESHHALFALMNKIYSERLTGKLQLVFGRVERQLFFDGGQLVFASSSDPQDSLGEMMLRAGALTQSQFEEASALVQTGQRFGSAIAEMGVCTVEEVTGWIQRQLTQITSSVLDYPAGRYYFFSSLETNVVPEVGIPVPLGKLLLEAVRRAKDLPLEPLAEDGELRVDLSPEPLLRYQAVELEENERGLLCALYASSGAALAKEVTARSQLPRSEAARALYALMVLGMVVSVPQGAGAEAGPGGAMPVPEPEAPAAESESEKQFEEEIRAVLELAEKGTYYELLGVTATSPGEEVKRNFHRLARKFHPDRHMGHSERVDLLQELMGRLTTAYETLADAEKRVSYDRQLAAGGAFVLGPRKTERQDTVEESLARAKQYLRAGNFAASILWLRTCVEIAPNVAKYHVMLARSLATVPEFRQEAIGEFEKALELDAWNTSTYFQLGELYEAMGMPSRAAPLYRKVLEIDPEHSKALARLSQIEEKGEEREEKSFVSRLFRRKR